ncbi:MAG: hypothetical protein JNK21_00145 [Rhodospirillaceae bacterium]|nr:hypothetical protein [Rhodospirillaceae bacterium]
MGRVCAWIGAQPFAVEIAESAWLFPIIESIHVLALALVVGSIAMVDLRLLGVVAVRTRVTERINHLLPYTWAAFTAAVVSGGLLFSSQAATYCANIHFQLKLGFLALAGINMAVFHLAGYRDVAKWDSDIKPPGSARIAGGVSLSLWVAIVCFGRWIGFD